MDLFGIKAVKESQEKVNKTVATFEKRVAELENDIKILMESFEELNKGLAEVRETKQTIIEQPKPQKDEVKKASKRGRKPKSVNNVASNSEDKEDNVIKADINELKSNKKEAYKRRGRPKKAKEEDKPTVNDEALSLETKTSDKVEKAKTKQSKKPKSEVVKSNTKRGRKPKGENKDTLGKKRGRPKKTAEPIPDAAVMGLDFDEPVEEKPVEKKNDKRAKPIKVDKNRKIESFADIVELTNKEE